VGVDCWRGSNLDRCHGVRVIYPASMGRARDGCVEVRNVSGQMGVGRRSPGVCEPGVITLNYFSDSGVSNGGDIQRRRSTGVRDIRKYVSM
jgi:hypothetical protein